MLHHKAFIITPAEPRLPSMVATFRSSRIVLSSHRKHLFRHLLPISNDWSPESSPDGIMTFNVWTLIMFYTNKLLLVHCVFLLSCVYIVHQWHSHPLSTELFVPHQALRISHLLWTASVRRSTEFVRFSLVADSIIQSSKTHISSSLPIRRYWPSIRRQTASWLSSCEQCF